MTEPSNNTSRAADTIPPHVYDTTPSFHSLNAICVYDVMHSFAKHNNFIKHESRLQEDDRDILLSSSFGANIH